MRPLLLVATVALLPTSHALAAEGTTYDVNSFQDLPDAGPLGDGVVDADLSTPGNQVTLRGAIQDANANPGLDFIVLPAGTFKLKIKGKDEDAALTGDLDILDDLYIDGESPTETIIDGKKAKDRLFHVHGVQLEIRNVMLRKGRASGGDARGGAIYADNGSELYLSSAIVRSNKCGEDGGGVAFVDSDGAIWDTLFLKNKAKDDGAGIDISGSGTVELRQITFQSNRAKEEGGGLEISEADVTVRNCTFFKNRARFGGAMAFEVGAEVVIGNCTVAKNIAKKGSAIYEESGAGNDLEVGNSIFDKNKKKAYSGPGLVSLGHNIESGDHFGFSHPADMPNTKARIAKKLGDHGGMTPTLALKADSPAIDAGDDATAPTEDQRGEPRIDLPGAGTSISDIGAFEYYEGPVQK